MQTSTAIAHPNIALVKYWGKRDRRLNLPAAGSLSLTLGPMRTRTSVTWGQDADTMSLDGIEASEKVLGRTSRFLDLIRELQPGLGGARVVSDNNFPTASGLASSASGFAALTMAATDAAGLSLSKAGLSVLSRRGSGSAARSLCGGFGVMKPGVLADGTDAWASPMVNAEWDLRVVILVADEGPKPIGSTEAMNLTERTSPFYQPWVDGVAGDIETAVQAIHARDFEQLGRVTEASTLRMHASAMAADPGLLYWRGVTVEGIHAVRALRAEGAPVFFTIDAGPHVKVFTTAEAADEVAQRLAKVPGVLRTLTAAPARSAFIVAEA